MDVNFSSSNKNTSENINNEYCSFERWEMPQLDHIKKKNIIDEKTLKRTHLNEQIKKFKQDIYDKSYHDGYHAGIAAAKNEMDSNINSLLALIEYQNNPINELSHNLKTILKQLSVGLAEQLLQKSIELDEEYIIGICHAAIDALSKNNSQISVYLNSDDLILIEDYIANNDNNHNFNLIVDKSLNRGECKVKNDISSVDATVSTRLEKIIKYVFDDNV